MNKTVKLLLYCTKAKPYLVEEYGFNGTEKQGIYYKCFPRKGIDFPILNGKIVAEAECDLVEEIKFINDSQYGTNTLNQKDLLTESCIGMFDLYEYLFNKDTGYGIYLKNVNPFEDPRELSYYGIKRAPQNMCFKRFPVPYENSLGGWEISKDEIIISVKPEWLCKILNGEKTIEVRTSILNALKELIRNDN